MRLYLELLTGEEALLTLSFRSQSYQADIHIFIAKRDFRKYSESGRGRRKAQGYCRKRADPSHPAETARQFA